MDVICIHAMVEKAYILTETLCLFLSLSETQNEKLYNDCICNIYDPFVIYL